MPRKSTAWTRASAASSLRWKRPDQLDNTLLIFLSDNGACAEDIPQGVTARELVDQLMIAKAKTRKGEPVRLGNDPFSDARRRGHLSELRYRLGQFVEYAVPALQALDP